MKRTRLQRRPRFPRRPDTVLALDPHDPDVVRAKRLLRLPEGRHDADGSGRDAPPRAA